MLKTWESNVGPPSVTLTHRLRCRWQGPVPQCQWIWWQVFFLQKTQDRQCHGWANVGEAS